MSAQWKHTYRGPGFKAHLLAILVFIVPKIGAAADLAIKIPSRRYRRTVFAKRESHGGYRFDAALDKFGVRAEVLDCAREYRSRHGTIT